MTNTKKKIFLLITIPTHLRVLMNTARMIDESRLFEPVLVYYPSAVFEHNYEGCRDAPYETWVWTGLKFISKTDYLTSNASGETPIPMSEKIFYSKLRNRFTLIYLKRLLINQINKSISITAPLLKLIFRLYRFIRATSRGLVSGIRDSATARASERKSILESILRSFFIGYYASEWELPIEQSPNNHSMINSRLINIRNLAELFTGMNDQKRFLFSLTSLLKQEKPSLIAFAEENLFYNSHLLIQTTQRLKIPTVIIPFTIANTLEWAETFYYDKNCDAQFGYRRVLATAFPNWTLNHRNKKMILPAIHVIGCEYHGTTPKIPWLINSGNADALAAESQFMYDYYVRAGIDKSKLRLTGALSDDILFNALENRASYRTDFANRFNIKLKNKIILIGIPPDQLGSGIRDGCEFNNYNNLVKFMVETVTSNIQNEYSVLINLHPRVQKDSLNWIEDTGAKIVDTPIETAIPLADLYIAVTSATVRLAMSCGIPVINYDAYYYNYDDFVDVSEVYEAKSKQQYTSYVEKLTSELLNRPDTNSKLTKAHNIDGKSSQRMLHLFSELISSSKLAISDITRIGISKDKAPV